jgi:hypothetical protein
MSSVLIFSSISPLLAQVPKEYKGKPFKDKFYKLGAQTIPGRVELAYYDLGGEGIAYHDKTPENEGAKLNHEVHDYGSHWRPEFLHILLFFVKMRRLIFPIPKIGRILTTPIKSTPK